MVLAEEESQSSGVPAAAAAAAVGAASINSKRALSVVHCCCSSGSSSAFLVNNGRQIQPTHSLYQSVQYCCATWCIRSTTDTHTLMLCYAAPKAPPRLVGVTSTLRSLLSNCSPRAPGWRSLEAPAGARHKQRALSSPKKKKACCRCV